MSVLLITPLLLATAPVQFNVPPSQYNHTAQTQSGFQLAQWNTGACYSTTTMNGTQTYDWNGRANDADSDSDSRGDC